MWHTFHYRDVTYFQLPWSDIPFNTVMWHTFKYRDVTYFSLPWCDILFTTVVWHTFNYLDVTHSPLPWCDILSTSVMWHTFHYCDATYFQLLGCDILSTAVMWHTAGNQFFLLVEMTPTVPWFIKWLTWHLWNWCHMPNWHHNPMKWKCLTNKGPPSLSDDPRQILAKRCHTTSSNAMHHKCYQLPWCDTLSIAVMWHTFH